MNTIVLQILVVIGPLVFGFGAAEVMHYLFNVSLTQLSFKDRFKNLSKVIGWFMGNGALVIGTLHWILANNGELSGANTAAFLSYLGGFGAGWIAIGRRPVLGFSELRRHLNELEFDIVVMKYRYDHTDCAIQELLAITPEEYSKSFVSAHRKLRGLSFETLISAGRRRSLTLVSDGAAAKLQDSN
jgi:hypothetical protein